MALLEWFQSIRCPFLDAFFAFWSFFGEEYFMLAAICIVYWCVDKRLAYHIGLCTFISGGIVQTTKIICRVPRPWLRDTALTPAESALATATGYSFPSGHTQTATAVFCGAALKIKKLWLYYAAGFVSLMVACARMYLGVHTPADVFTAMAIALAVSLAVALILKDDAPDRKRDLVTALVLLAVGLASVVTALVLLDNGTAEYVYLSDTVKFGAAVCGFAVAYYVERGYIDFPTNCKLWQQPLKFLLGVAGVLAIKEGVKLIATGPIPDIIRYFLVICWGMMLYPLIIKKLFPARKS